MSEIIITKENSPDAEEAARDREALCEDIRNYIQLLSKTIGGRIGRKCSMKVLEEIASEEELINFLLVLLTFGRDNGATAADLKKISSENPQIYARFVSSFHEDGVRDLEASKDAEEAKASLAKAREEAARLSEENELLRAEKENLSAEIAELESQMENTPEQDDPDKDEQINSWKSRYNDAQKKISELERAAAQRPGGDAGSPRRPLARDLPQIEEEVRAIGACSIPSAKKKKFVMKKKDSLPAHEAAAGGSVMDYILFSGEFSAEQVGVLYSISVDEEAPPEILKKLADPKISPECMLMYRNYFVSLARRKEKSKQGF